MQSLQTQQDLDQSVAPRKFELKPSETLRRFMEAKRCNLPEANEQRRIRAEKAADAHAKKELFIRKSFTGLKAVYREITKIVEVEHGLSKRETRFFVHVFCSTNRTADDDRFVPIPFDLIYREFRNNAKGRRPPYWELIDAGLLEYREYVPMKYCREYAIPVEILDRLNQITVGEFRKVDLTTGCAFEKVIAFFQQLDVTKRSKNQSKLTDANRNPVPELVRDAIVAMTKERRFDAVELFKYLQTKLEANYPLDSPEGRSLLGELHCVYNVLATGVIYHKDYASYSATYKMQDFSGRKTEIGGGFQSITRGLKQQIIGNLMGVHNYDLVAAQVNLLRLQFKRRGISTRFLDEYMERGKHYYANLVGLDDDTWKVVLLALIMGALLPSGKQKEGGFWILTKKTRHAQEVERVEVINEIAYAVWKSLKGQFADPKKRAERCVKICSQINKVLAELSGDLKAWHNQLIAEARDEHGKAKKRLKNACGVWFPLSEYTNPKGQLTNIKELKRKLAAFNLQGDEQHFIDTLIVCLSKRGIDIQGHEHDGITTLGRIPDEAVEEAWRITRLPKEYVQIEEKPFDAKTAKPQQNPETAEIQVLQNPTHETYEHIDLSTGDKLPGCKEHREGRNAPGDSQGQEPASGLGLHINTLQPSQGKEGTYLKRSRSFVLRTSEVSNALEERVKNYLEGKQFVTTAEVLKHLKDQLDSSARSSQMQVAEILKFVGCVRKQKKIDGKKQYVFVVPTKSVNQLRHQANAHTPPVKPALATQPQEVPKPAPTPVKPAPALTSVEPIKPMLAPVQATSQMRSDMSDDDLFAAALADMPPSPENRYGADDDDDLFDLVLADEPSKPTPAPESEFEKAQRLAEEDAFWESVLSA